MFTKEQWKGSFHEDIQGETFPLNIDEEIYNDFMGALPPAETGKTRHEFSSITLPIQSYFLCGEPYSHNHNGILLYDCFAKSMDKFWYIGLLTKKYEQ